MYSLFTIRENKNTLFLAFDHYDVVAEFSFDRRVSIYGTRSVTGSESEGSILEWSHHAASSHPS